MVKKTIFIFIGLVFLISGCATTHKSRELEMQGLKNQISALETQLQVKDQEIEDLKEALDKAKEERALAVKVLQKKVIAEVKSRPKAKQIQMALKNAGYNPGPIDGKIGRQTRQAIRAFQKANNLSIDGKAGKDTWNLLKEYLYKKVR